MSLIQIEQEEYDYLKNRVSELENTLTTLIADNNNLHINTNSLLHNNRLLTKEKLFDIFYKYIIDNISIESTEEERFAIYSQAKIISQEISTFIGDL